MARKILVVDDEPDFLRMVEIRLKTNKYQTILACDGKMGLEMAAREHPDLIILDIMMPVMNGVETLRALKQNPETRFIPVIMVTAKKEPEFMMETDCFGASDYITKPLQDEVLMATIKRCLR